MSTHDVFLSYRRDGGFSTAKLLFDKLVRDGYSVTFDIDTLRQSGRFDQTLLSRIDECTDFVIVLNEGCFNRSLDPDFPPENDWMRQELAYALRQGKNVIPIMLNGFAEFPSNLPPDIADVAKMNGPKYSREYFDNFYERLKEFLRTTEQIDAPNKDSHSSTLLWFFRLKLKQKFGLALLVVLIWFGGIMMFSSSPKTIQTRSPAVHRHIAETKNDRQAAKAWLILVFGVVIAIGLMCDNGQNDQDENDDGHTNDDGETKES